MRHSLKHKIYTALRIGCLWLFALICLAPFYVAFCYAFKSKADFAETQLAFPTTLYLQNFKDALELKNYFNSVKNSAIVAIGVVILIIIFCSMSAYMITRRNNKFYNVIFYIFQMVILVPFQSIMFPLYKELYTMHALSTLWGLVRLVDPFFQYHKPLSGFPYKVDNQLSQNPGMARKLDYTSVLLGSSMTASFDTDWFMEELGENTVKLSYNGAYPKDEANIMELIFDAKKDTVKTVFMAIDQGTFSADVNETKYPIPEYLYDKNPFNNIQYVFNKDVILNYILKPLVDETERTDWTQLYKPWWTDQYYTKANVLMYYVPAEEAEEEMEADVFLDGVEANLQTNILPYIEAHPETEFVFFYPPYSILYWNDVMRLKQLDAVIEELSYMTERLLSYENVRVFCFQNQRQIVCDLNNYADYTHYHADVCRYIVECFANGDCELTQENYEGVFEDLRELASGYDYEAIYDNWYD